MERCSLFHLANFREKVRQMCSCEPTCEQAVYDNVLMHHVLGSVGICREQREAKRVRREQERAARDAARQKRSANRRTGHAAGARRGKDEL